MPLMTLLTTRSVSCLLAGNDINDFVYWCFLVSMSICQLDDSSQLVSA